MSAPVTAIFDVCDTLYAENTTRGFLEHVHGGSTALRVRTWLASSRWSPLRYIDGLVRRLARADLGRSLLVGSLRGRTRGELETAVRSYAEKLQSCGNRQVLRRLEEHKAAGHRVILMSNSLDLVVAEIADRLGVEWRASRLELVGERCTGRIAETLAWRKHQLVRELASGTLLHVYTDNPSDLDLLRLADHPVVIVPAGRTAQWARSVDAELLHV